ncbi:MAG TPA: S8 family serine peptidase [Candidatus Thermoplasmatota archaeon]|nr:S8 family serine peptidase [Candidatus Thermoplasmatota archaeon]
MAKLPALACAALLAALLPGCAVGEARTEWAFEVAQFTQLASAGRTGHGVVVALLDTGISPQHAALKHLFDGSAANGEVTAFRDLVNGRDGVASAYDDEGHGSHVAGILAASGSSLSDKLSYGGVNLLGGAPGVQLLVAKVCGPSDCPTDAVTRGVEWAAAQHAQVISMSLGARAGFSLLGLTDSQAAALRNAVQSALDHGIVVVAAAGNDGAQASDVSTPASIPGVLAVGAIQEDGGVWAQSSRGDNAGQPCRTLPLVGQSGRCDPNKKPELVAPGVNILSAWTGDGYARASGTSQATPFVAAAVALLLEGRPALRDAAGVQHLKQVLEQTAKPVPGQATPHDDAAGYGLLQAKAALAAYQ